jgi:uncharacterized protein (DUF1330 family)
VVIEGEAPSRHVIVEFPSRTAAERWFESPEYQRILPIAKAASRRDVVIIEGV